MLTVEDKENRLKSLYANRNFLIFANGEQWFSQQAQAIHREWLVSGTWLEITDSDVLIDTVAWEMDNNII